MNITQESRKEPPAVKAIKKSKLFLAFRDLLLPVIATLRRNDSGGASL